MLDQNSVNSWSFIKFNTFALSRQSKHYLCGCQSCMWTRSQWLATWPGSPCAPVRRSAPPGSSQAGCSPACSSPTPRYSSGSTSALTTSRERRRQVKNFQWSTIIIPRALVRQKKFDIQSDLWHPIFLILLILCLLHLMLLLLDKSWKPCVQEEKIDALIESKVVNTVRYESVSWPGLIIAFKERPLTWSWNLFRFKNPLSISSWRWTWNLWCWLSGPWAGPMYIIIKWTYCGKILNK